MKKGLTDRVTKFNLKEKSYISMKNAPYKRTLAKGIYRVFKS